MDDNNNTAHGYLLHTEAVADAAIGLVGQTAQYIGWLHEGIRVIDAELINMAQMDETDLDERRFAIGRICSYISDLDRFRAEAQLAMGAYADDVHTQANLARQFAAAAQAYLERIIALHDDPDHHIINDASNAGAPERRRRVFRIRYMIRHFVTDGDFFTLARRRRVLGMADPFFPIPPDDLPDGERATFIRSVRDALVSLPADMAIRQQVMNHRIMAVVFALAHNGILAHEPATTISRADLRRVADGIFDFVTPLATPHAMRAQIDVKRRQLRELCVEVLRLRVDLIAASGPAVRFIFDGPLAGQLFLLHADRVRVSSYEGLAAPPTEANADEQIAYCEFSGLVRLTAAGGRGQIRAVWETRPIVVVRSSDT